MNLMEAVFAHLHIENGKNGEPQYRVEQLVIYLIWTPEQAEISEIGWTKLAEGYTGNGGGFSHYPAGRSNRSAHKVASETWSYALLVALKASPLRDNIMRKEDQKETRNDAEIKELEFKIKQTRIARLADIRDRARRFLLSSEEASDTTQQSLHAEYQRTKRQVEDLEQLLRAQIRDNYAHMKNRASALADENRWLSRNDWELASFIIEHTINALQIGESNPDLPTIPEPVLRPNRSPLSLTSSTVFPPSEDETSEYIPKRERRH
jgi:hypothetical protein